MPLLRLENSAYRNYYSSYSISCLCYHIIEVNFRSLVLPKQREAVGFREFRGRRHESCECASNDDGSTETKEEADQGYVDTCTRP